MYNVNLLISSGAGSGVYGLVNHLYSLPDHKFKIIITDMANESLMKNFVDSMITTPPIGSENYKGIMLDLCSSHQINVVIPCISDDVLFYAENITDFTSINAVPTVSNYQASKTAIDKLACYEFLNQRGIRVPIHYEVNSVNDFKHAARELGYPRYPICFKPSRHPNGSGKGFRIIDPSVNIYKRMFYELTTELYYVSYDAVIEAMEHEKTFPTLMVMEYLPDEEYSVYCFCQKGRAHYVVPNLRLKLDGMTTNTAEVVNNHEIEEMAREICSAFEFEHNVNIQIKYSRDRKAKVVEINPRLAGTISLPIAAGVDLMYYSILMAMGEQFPQNQKIRYGTRVSRYSKEMFSYEDETFEYAAKKVDQI